MTDKNKNPLPVNSVLWEDAAQDIHTKEQLEAFIEDNIASQYSSFKEYFDEYIAEHNLVIPDIMRKSNIDRGYFYNIINGVRQPKRDKVIAVCIAAGMDLAHLNRGLRISKYSKLDPKDERDMRIRFAVNSGVSNVVDLNIELDDAGLDPL